MRQVGTLLGIIVAVGWVGFVGNAWADDGANPDRAAHGDVVIDAWLALGPVDQPLPLFSTVEPGSTSAALLDEPVVRSEGLWPQLDEALVLGVGEAVFWRERSQPDGEVMLQPPEGKSSLALLACYLDSSRRQKVDLVVIKTLMRASGMI